MSPDPDVTVLRAAAAVANAAAGLYAGALPLLGGQVPDFAVSFVTSTRARHVAQAAAFNAAATSAGGAPQHDSDAAFVASVQAAAPAVTDLDTAVGLGVALELAAQQSLVLGVGAAVAPSVRSLLVAAAAVVARQRAILLAMQALISAGDTTQITARPTLSALPASVGSVSGGAFSPAPTARTAPATP